MIDGGFKRLIGTMAEQSGIGVIMPSGKRIFDASPGRPTLEFRSRPLLAKMLFRPSLALGEAYADGKLIIHDGDLRSALMPLAAAFNETNGGVFIKWAEKLLMPLTHSKEGRGRRQSKHNIHHHYDLGNDFYQLFLDKDMQYSCAYFKTPTTDLESAQRDKKAHIINKLHLHPGMKVLDIGCGWGGMAMMLAGGYGAQVTGITLSEAQCQKARSRAAESGLPVSFHCRDYRDETTRYDRVVSVGMFEHVGKRLFDQYFRSVSRVLSPDGIALIHTIGSTKCSGGRDSFISRYIFPGGYIPKLSEIMKAVEKTDLKVTDIEVWHDHYAMTLNHWYRRFMAARYQAEAMFGERLCRLWEFYLLSCEAGFRHGSLVVYQLQLAKGKGLVPITRDYLYKENPRLQPKIEATTGRLDAR